MAGQFDEALKTFKGFDDDGNPVFGDEATGEFNSLDKTEYSELANEARSQFGEKKFSDTYEDYQAKKITADKDYLGNDKDGNSVFKNKAGIIERAKLNFSEGLKRQFGDKTFTKAGEGLNNQKVGENKVIQAPVLRSNNSSQGNLNNAQAIQSPGYNPRGSLNQPKQTNWNQNPTYFRKQAQKAIDQDYSEYEEVPYEEEYMEEPAPSMTKQLTEIAKQQAKEYAQKKAKEAVQQQTQPYVNQANNIVSGYKNEASAVGQQYTNQAKNYGQQQLNAYIPGDLKNQYQGYSNLANTAQDAAKALKDPKALAEQQAKAYGKAQLANALQKSGYGQYAGLVTNGIKSVKDVQELINDPSKLVDAGKAAALDYGKNALKNALAGSEYGGAASAAVDLASNYKEVLKDPKEFLKEQAKEQLKYQLGEAASGLTGGVNVAGLVDAFAGGGDKGDAAGRAAAMAAWTAATGGVGAVVNPATLQLAAGLTDKGADKLKNSNLGIAGKALGTQAELAGTGMQLGADVGNSALNLAGGIGSDFFKSGEADVKAAKDSVKKITSGDIVGGLGSLGSTALKSVFNNVYKAPVQVAKRAAAAAKKVVSSVGKSIKSIFCFTPDTLIIMADGSTKKIGDIKVGEEVALGGLVIAIGEALNQDLWIYNGVKVSGGHLVLENAEWVRVQDSTKGKRLPNKNKSIVIPMTNENHLIMTADYQVWRDMDEVDDTFNKTDDDIVEELNGQQKLNALLQEKTDELKKI